MKKTFCILIMGLLILSQLLAVLDFGVKNVTGASVSGHITSDTLWISSASPYWIEDNVTVDEGVTLYIESGVEVRFNGYYNLFVEGNLKAIGEQSNVINFTSNKTSPFEGDWSSIHINSTGHLEMNYCAAQYGNRSITLFNNSNNKITNSTITLGYDRGIYLYNSSFNTISNCEVISIHSYGIYVESSSNNTIQDCNSLSNGARGLYLRYSTYNEITGCNVSNNGRNVYLTASSNNSITKSYISGGYAGIKMMHFSNWNEIHHNSFVNNVNQANDSYTNYWDDGAEGNYWSDYSGSDADGDGIGDVPYNITGNSNQDRYPLMTPWGVPPTIISVTPQNLAANIPVTTNIVVIFSEPMNKTATEGAFTLETNGVPISGTFSWNIANDTMTFNPTADLVGEAKYWINITTSATDLAGNALSIPWTSSFTTEKDTTPPTITDITAIPDPQEVYNYVNISAIVSDLIQVDTVWVNITDPDGDTMGNFTMIYDSVTSRYYKNQSYSIVGIYHFVIFANDTNDNWKFSSGQFTMQDTTPPIVSSTSPTSGQIDVPINTSITITFSKAMNKTAVQTAITISNGLTPTSFNWSNENRTLTFTPLSDLNYDMQYTIIINASVAEDIAGNKLDGDKDGIGGDDYRWSFTTEVGIISGLVKDDKGNPLPNAIVTVYYLNGSILGSTITNESGNYTINVPPGIYDIKIEKKGCDTQWKRGLFVRVGQETNLQITMTATNNLVSEYWWVVLLVFLFIIVTVATWTLIRRKSR